MSPRYRPLQPGLLVEGSDGPYLSTLVKRQLEQLVLEYSSQTVLVLDCVVPDHVRTNASPTSVIAAAQELARDCGVVFLHGDEDARAERLKLVDELNEKRLIVGSAGVAVPLVPVLMTESWMLADRKALESVVGKELLTDYPYTRPAAVEGRVAMRRSKEKLTPKQVWTNLMGDDANEILHDRSELLAQRTDLRVLAQLPSYREWCDGVERALRTLGFL